MIEKPQAVPAGATKPEGSQGESAHDSSSSCLSCLRLEGERDSDSTMIASLLDERDEAREAAALWRDQLAATKVALADAQAQLAARTWQPIATAPKDGPSVLLLTHSGVVVIGTWLIATAASPCWWAMGDYCVFPTHWMPLPPAPSVDAVAGTGDEGKALPSRRKDSQLAALSPDPFPVQEP